MNMQDPNCFNDNFNIISESLICITINILEEFVKEIQKEHLNGSNKLKSDSQRSVNTELKIFNLNFVFDNSSYNIYLEYFIHAELIIIFKKRKDVLVSELKLIDKEIDKINIINESFKTILRTYVLFFVRKIRIYSKDGIRFYKKYLEYLNGIGTFDNINVDKRKIDYIKFLYNCYPHIYVDKSNNEFIKSFSFNYNTESSSYEIKCLQFNPNNFYKITLNNHEDYIQILYFCNEYNLEIMLHNAFCDLIYYNKLTTV
ncbi:hypothetical protein GVAV_001763 [Gurleya vavrai]